MILGIVGEPTDMMPAFVAWLAERRNIEVLWFRESALGDEWSFSVDDNGSPAGMVWAKDRTIAISEIGGLYVNMNPSPALPWSIELPKHEMGYALATRRSSLYAFIDALPCLVANRSFAGRSNNSKPHQMQLLAAAGFSVPNWIVSNDALVVARYVEAFKGEVIAKSASGLRSHVKRVDEELLGRLAEGATAIIAQRMIVGRDVRVHTVGSKAFATEVLSGSVDYRFDDGDKVYRMTSLPARVEQQCIAFAESESMVIAGFDFKVADDGHWYCLEMNPVPTFLSYEMLAEQSIGDALLDLFAL